VSDDFEHVGKIKAHFARHRNGWSWETTADGFFFTAEGTNDRFTLVIPAGRIISAVGNYDGSDFVITDKNPKTIVKKLLALFS